MQSATITTFLVRLFGFEKNVCKENDKDTEGLRSQFNATRWRIVEPRLVRSQGKRSDRMTKQAWES